MANGRRRKQHIHSYYSLYNIVAGRHRSESKNNKAISDSPLAPDEYLLKRRRKLQLYPFEEHPDLPESSLVMAIHWYVSKRAAVLGPLAFECMDATALLAIAVEVEEQIKASLGDYGHLAYAQKKRPETPNPGLDISDTEAEEEADEVADEEADEAREELQLKTSMEQETSGRQALRNAALENDSLSDSSHNSVNGPDNGADSSNDFSGDSDRSSDESLGSSADASDASDASTVKNGSMSS